MGKDIFIRSASAAILAGMLSGSVMENPQLPLSLPTVPVEIPTQVPENSSEFDNYVYETEGYNIDLRNELQEMWIHGTEPNKLLRLNFPNGQQASFMSLPYTTNSDLEGSSNTDLRIINIETQPGSHSLVFTAAGNLDTSSHRDWDQNTASELTKIDIEHEILATDGYISFISSFLKAKEFDVGLSLEQQGEFPPTDKLKEAISQASKKSSNAYEAVAEINDYFLLRSLVDKDSNGKPVLIHQQIDQGNNVIEEDVPLIKGMPYQDKGLFYAVETTIGWNLDQYPNFETFIQKNKRFSDIPGFQKYSDEVERIITE